MSSVGWWTKVRNRSNVELVVCADTVNVVNTSDKVSVYFPDFTVVRGKNASDALLKIGKKQWKYEDRLGAIKQLLAKRAFNWSGAQIDPTLPSPEFLVQLGESGMVFVWFGDGNPWTGLVGDA